MKSAKVYPFRLDITPQPQPKRWKWNKAKAADSLREVVGMAAVAAFLTWLAVGWVTGQWN